jgi:hypothetical protein
MVVLKPKFGGTYELEIIEQDFRGRSNIVTRRRPIKPWPELIAKLRSLLQKFSGEVEFAYRHVISPRVVFHARPAVAVSTCLLKAVSFDLQGGER